MSGYEPKDRRDNLARGEDRSATSERGQSGGQARERMSADYDDEPPPRRRAAAAHGIDLDAWTKRLIYAAAGIGVVLLTGVGGWTLLSGHHGGIPVLGPPPGPVRVKPANPGGMQLADTGNADTDLTGRGVAHLAPGPEQPDPAALAQHTAGDAPAASDRPAADAAVSPPPAQSAPSPAATSDVPHQPAVPSKTSNPVPPVSVPSEPLPAVSSPPKPVTRTPSPKPQPAAPQRQLPPPVAVASSGVDAASGSVPQGHQMVQLAALDTAAQAQAEWVRLQHRAPDLLSARSPVMQPVMRGGATLYRLRVSGFADLAQARSFCAQLRAEHVACTPAAF